MHFAEVLTDGSVQSLWLNTGLKWGTLREHFGPKVEEPLPLEDDGSRQQKGGRRANAEGWKVSFVVYEFAREKGNR